MSFRAAGGRTAGGGSELRVRPRGATTSVRAETARTDAWTPGPVAGVWRPGS